MRDKMRVFSQFLSSGEHDRLIASLEREKELRLRLSELMKYRSLGLTTQEEIIHYEQHVAHERQTQLRQNKSVSFCTSHKKKFKIVYSFRVLFGIWNKKLLKILIVIIVVKFFFKICQFICINGINFKKYFYSHFLL